MTDPASVTAAYPSPPNYSSPPAQKLSPGSWDRFGTMSLSPEAYGSKSPQPPGGGYGSTSSQDKSPLSTLNLSFLKSLTEKRTTRDGQPPKRRGPKPDSKPALTRRQELNRQAQRTHRERKELYIKALEDEVLRLKEIYSNISTDKERLSDENRQLKMMLAANGIPWSSVTSGGAGPADDLISNPSIGYTSSASVAGGGGGFTPSMVSHSTAPSTAGGASSRGQHMHGQSPPPSHGYHASPSSAAPPPQQQQRTPAIDYEQAGIDFVLTLEKPCMDHLPWLLERASESGGEPCGHALMASCPPEPFSELSPDLPFGYRNIRQPAQGDGSGAPGETLADGQRTWELTKADLATLMDLSAKLNLDGEITPVMAWAMVRAHPRFYELGLEDFARLCEELGGKVRCYGFGAVMEEFEVRDALENVFSMKPEVIPVY